MLLIWWNYYRRHEPKRGDLVIYDYPADKSLTYLSRVVGLPGDRVQVKDGILRVNGRPVERELIEVRENPGRPIFVDEIATYREKLPNGRRYRIKEYGDEFPGTDNTPEYIVPQDRYFVLDDNRDRSQDSRDTKRIGFIERGKIHHFPTFVVWSQDWSRVGTRVQPLP